MTDFDYQGIPVGYYDEILHSGGNIRKSWHLQKFERVLEALPERPHQTLLDIGCFAGTFLSLVPKSRFETQLGVDILPNQIEYANRVHGTAFRKFRTIKNVETFDNINESFDCITLIEVIEHLDSKEIHDLFTMHCKYDFFAWLICMICTKMF